MAAKAGDILKDGEVLRVLARIEEHLAALRNGANAPVRQWLTVDEAAEELQTSRDTVERLIASGNLQAAELTTRAGRGSRRRYRIRRDWLDAYLLGTVHPEPHPTRERRRPLNGQPKVDFIG